MSNTRETDRVSAAPAGGHAKEPVRAKGKRTRERLLAAAVTVFERDGYGPARVADIVKEAGVAHGSFYTYFDSKEDVFREAAGTVVDEINAALDTASVGLSSRQLVRAGNEMFLDMYRRHAPMLALIEQLATADDYFRAMRLDLRRRLARRVEGAIRHMTEAGDTRIDGLDRHVLANALAGMADNFAYTTFVLKEPMVGDAVDTLDAIWLRTLGIADGS